MDAAARDVTVPSNVLPLRRGATTAKGSRSTRRSFGKIRTLRSGKFQASYIGKDGQRHYAPVTFDVRSDAGAWLDMRHAELLEYRWKPTPPPERPSISFGDYATEWLVGRELKPRTRSEYAKTLKPLMAYFGDAQLTDITSSDVKSWYATLDPDKKTARAHAYSLLRTIFATAASDEWIETNPCRLRGAATTKRAIKIRPATLHELEVLTRAMPERHQAMVLLAAWCALRFGELTELRRKDILFDDSGTAVVRVQRAVTWPDTSMPVIGTPKSDAGVRDVALPPHLTPMILHHLEKHAQDGPDGLLFPNRNGEHMHHGSLYKVFRRARAVAGREDLRFHDLRHTGATLAARSGATLAELMARLGHSTVGAALRYQHAAADRDAEIARKLSDMAAGR